MKNLFSYCRTDDNRRSVLDESPYITATLSEDLSARLDQTVDESYRALMGDQTEKKGRSLFANPLLWLALICCLPAIILGTALARNAKIDQVELWGIICIATMILGAVLLTKISRRQKQEIKDQLSETVDFDFQGSMETMNRLSEEARRELQVPNDAVEVEVLPFVYRDQNGTARSCYPANTFDNQPVLMWCQGRELCLFDQRHVLTLPLETLSGRITYRKTFTIEMWLKPIKYTDGKYQPYHIKSAGLMACRAKTYYGIVIRQDDRETCQLLIPAYDWPEVEKLVRLKDLGEG